MKKNWRIEKSSLSFFTFSHHYFHSVLSAATQTERLCAVAFMVGYWSRADVVIKVSYSQGFSNKKRICSVSLMFSFFTTFYVRKAINKFPFCSSFFFRCSFALHLLSSFKDFNVFASSFFYSFLKRCIAHHWFCDTSTAKRWLSNGLCCSLRSSRHFTTVACQQSNTFTGTENGERFTQSCSRL